MLGRLAELRLNTNFDKTDHERARRRFNTPALRFPKSWSDILLRSYGLIALLGCSLGCHANHSHKAVIQKLISPDKKYVATETDLWDDDDAFVDFDICPAKSTDEEGCESVGSFGGTFEFKWLDSKTLRVKAEREGNLSETKSGVRILYGTPFKDVKK